MEIAGEFGSCCEDLAECMELPNSFFRIEDNNVLYLTVGYIQTEEGTGFLDHAVVHCPFCGTLIHSPEEIRRRSEATQETGNGAE